MRCTLEPVVNVGTPNRPQRNAKAGAGRSRFDNRTSPYRRDGSSWSTVGTSDPLELRAGPIGPRTLGVRCDGMSSSVLHDRLRDQRAPGLIDRTNDDAYVLSNLGASLGPPSNHCMPVLSRGQPHATIDRTNVLRGIVLALPAGVPSDGATEPSERADRPAPGWHRRVTRRRRRRATLHSRS